MKKIYSLLFVLTLLTGCVESMALLGPVTSGAGSQKIAQSAVSSAVSFGVKKQTGKSPGEHALAYVKKYNPESKKEKCIEFIDATNSSSHSQDERILSIEKKLDMLIKIQEHNNKRDK